MTGNHCDAKVNWRRFEVAKKLAKNCDTVLLTGVGEPTLYPGLIDEYLERLQEFPIVELQTNGTRIGEQIGYKTLGRWQDHGLELISISITHYDPLQNARLMGISPLYNFWSVVNRCNVLGFSVRLNCTLLKDGIDTVEKIQSLIDSCRETGVAQLTIREVAVPMNTEGPIAQYCRSQYAGVLAAFEPNCGVLLRELPHGGRIYDVDGQNVCISNCMTTDPKETRNLIFFPDGAIRYDWQHKGARIL
jgi:hypothetical protein